jgi:hypothetical protein
LVRRDEFPTKHHTGTIVSEQVIRERGDDADFCAEGEHAGCERDA